MKLHQAFRIAGTLLVLACAGFLLSGCARLKTTYPEKRFFMITSERDAPPVSLQNPGILLIEDFSISPAFQSKEMVYRTGQLEYETDFYHNFFLPPAEMITIETRRWISDSGLVSMVTGRRSPLEARYRLEASIPSLYADLRGDSPEAVFEIQFLLLDTKSRPPAVVLQRDYRQEHPLPDTSAESVVEGFSLALEAVLSRFENDLLELMR